MLRSIGSIWLLMWLTGVCWAAEASQSTPTTGTTVVGYASIQAAIDANPGRQLFVPAGDYTIERAIEIRQAGSGLFGPGRIIQTNPEEMIIHVISANGTQLRDLTLTRAAGKQDTQQRGLLADNCTDLVLENLQVLDNRGGLAIRISVCTDSQIRHCLVRNYAGFGVEDRTKLNEFGLAFNKIDGTGIQVDNSVGTLVIGNRVIESNLAGTPELHKKLELGKIVKRSSKPGATPPSWFVGDSVKIWHQGSGIHVSNPNVTDYTQVIGNTIENAGQGLDVHGDHVVISGNIIRNSFMGMKAIHGSRNVQIIGNQFSKNDLWGIMVEPGSASTPGHDASTTQSLEAPNLDGGTIIANNVISDFGYGNEYWNWKDAEGYGIVVIAEQNGMASPLRDVIVTGNVVYDTGRDRVVEQGKLVKAPPRYKYALRIDEGPETSFVVSNNILHPGQLGAANVDLTRFKAKP